MDALLKQLAEASLRAESAEEAAAEAAWNNARDALDEADVLLADLRAGWPEMSSAERALVGRTAAPLRARLDAVRGQVPKLAAVSEGAPESDPDEDAEPA